MTRRGMMIIMTIGAFGLVLMLIMLQQALEETKQVGPLLKLRREIEQTFAVNRLKVLRTRVSSVASEPAGSSDKRFWIVVRAQASSSDRDDEQLARSMIDQMGRMYEGDRQEIYGYRVEMLTSGDEATVKLVVKKTRGPAPITVTRPGENQ